MSEQTTVDRSVNKPAEQQTEQKKLTLSNPIKSSISLVLFLCWILLMVPVLFFYKAFNKKNLGQFYLKFHSGACRIFSLRCQVEGEISKHHPTLFLPNHISYLDVIVLGAYVPAYFIAKSEVAGWPLLGTLAKLQNTLFFERKGNKVRTQLDVMSEHFNQKKNLILFAEGTSTEGEHVEPFKSSLLHSVENTEEKVFIQPVTIAYTHHKNQKMNKVVRDHYAWYGTMPFGSHFFSAAGMGKADVKIIFHSPVTLDAFETRKACAQHCYLQVKVGLEQSLA